MKTFFIHLMMLLCVVPAIAQDADGGSSKLISFFKNLSEYDSKCSQEKVYLHLDNNAYFSSENIYFKAYVSRASTLLPTDLSAVLYVELRDEDGNMIVRKNYEIVDGQASGSLPLSDLMHSGFYEVRAFTRAMLNWDGDYCFSRLVPVYETADTTGAFAKPFIQKHERNLDIPLLRKEPATLRSASAQHSGIYVELYPEGGALVEGAKQNVAFRVTNKQGLPEKAECRLYDGAGGIVTTAQTEHEGMGTFALPSSGGAYRLTFTGSDGKERDFKLPEVRTSGIAATVTESDDSIGLQISPTPDLINSTIGISITCRGAACRFDTLRLAASQSWSTPKHMLRYGINQITLFNDRGDVLWERLVWRKPQWPVSLNVKQNANVYSPFAPVVLDMTLADDKGNPCNAYFSLAVHDIAGELDGSDVTANADLLLASDLKGFIARPEYYFESDDAVHRRALDLLLLVQGWRRYDWAEMAGTKPFTLRQPVEDGQLLTGTLLAPSDKRVPMPGARLDVNVFFPGTKISGSCVTDEEGNFALMPPKYYGEGIGRFRTYVGEKEKAMRVVLDRNFTPDLRTLDPQEFLTYPYSRAAQPAPEDNFEWVDTITKGDIRLNAAVVRAKRKDNTTAGRRFWMGGEAFARRNCDIYYNIPYELMRYCDKGEEVPLIWELIASINSKFDFFRDDNGFKFTYKNRPLTYFLEGEDQADERHRMSQLIFANEVRSVYFSTTQKAANLLIARRGEKRDDNFVMYIYLNDEPELLKEQGKSHVVRFFGYSTDEDFTAPDYRKRDLPDQKDFRRTLYWNPDVLADENGKASVVFYSNAQPGVKLGITARAVLPDGSILDFQR